MRRLVSVVLVAMVVSVALLPPEHVHLRPDGHSYTHRHSIVLSSRNRSMRAHESSDHSHAIFLNPVFVGQITFATAQLALAVGQFVLAPPERTLGDGLVASSVRINGPPPQTRSSRAPPLA
ncbi:MAG TPA: hypothetical protein VGY48_07580 [Vicinamibacterales bacterium]|jgi:hypothetical protein|nr:hypothetical protein [Vicinamibacterales bacterium]